MSTFIIQAKYQINFFTVCMRKLPNINTIKGYITIFRKCNRNKLYIWGSNKNKQDTGSRFHVVIYRFFLNTMYNHKNIKSIAEIWKKSLFSHTGSHSYNVTYNTFPLFVINRLQYIEKSCNWFRFCGDCSRRHLISYTNK